MDAWQKAETSSKILATLLIPLTIAYLANQVSSANKQRDSETKFVELATAILAKEPVANQAAESKNLRRWAVAVIDRFSGVPMPKETAEALVQTTALPSGTSGSLSVVPAADPAGTWGVVFGGDTTLDGAKTEITTTAQRMGIGQGTVFRRSGSYRSVRVFVSRAEAEDALGKARAVRPSSYVVNMTAWCPTSVEKTGYFECGAP